MKTKGWFFFNMKRMTLTVMVLFLAGMINIIATPADSIISEANRHYYNLEFDKAAALYKSVVDEGYSSAGLFYNLGNAYYKQDQLAEAILFYEKALKLSPFDKDIRDNLEMANMLTVDKVEGIPEFFLKRWWIQMVNLFSPNVWAISSLLLFVLSLLFFLLYIIRTKPAGGKMRWLTSGLVLVFFSVLVYVCSISRRNNIVQNDHAVIMDLSVTVKSSPDELGTDAFMLHEGTKVEILDSLENWREIKIANGSKGWVLKESVGEI